MTDTQIPEGMKPWNGGDGPPADWDGGQVLLGSRHGNATLMAEPISTNQWFADADLGVLRPVIAYTPKPPAYPEGMTPELVAQMVALVRQVAGDTFGHRAVEARDILADLEPVDPLREKLRDTVIAAEPDALMAEDFEDEHKEDAEAFIDRLIREAPKHGLAITEATP